MCVNEYACVYAISRLKRIAKHLREKKLTK